MSFRSDFPIFAHQPAPFVYLDSAASTQKPACVIDAVSDCYQKEYSNVHRGVHRLSQQLSARYEAVREQIATFIGATEAAEIVFTKGTTEAMNLLAHALSAVVLTKGDKVLITAMEHHANIVPWQLACQRYGAELVVLPMNAAGELETAQLAAKLEGVKIFALTQVSNALGTINPVKALIAQAKGLNPELITIVDGAQAVAHLAVDVSALGCDFYAFSGHKLYAPTGVGVLYGKRAWLEKMPPYQGGGDMILSVSFEKTEFAPPPHKFEAGTPPIAAVIGLGEAIKWVASQEIARLAAHEMALHQRFEQALRELEGVRIIGTAAEKAAVTSFVIEGVHPHDAGTIFDACGVAVRVGHHCAEPVMRFFGLPATIRASFAAYNQEDDVYQCVEAIKRTQALFA